MAMGCPDEDGGDLMGNRALIVTEDDFNKGSGMSLYLHWNGGRDSVEAFLQYCKLRGFRSPDKDEYGWARLSQIVANFLGADGLSVGVGYCSNIHNDVGDNGIYIIRGWDIVGREFYSGQEQNEYDRTEFLYELDDVQPLKQQIGRSMIDSLLYHGVDLDDASCMYHYTIGRRIREKTPIEGFIVGKRYGSSYKGPIEVIDKNENYIKVRFKGEEVTLPKFNWKDGSESAVIGNGYSKNILESTEVIQ